jgi:hypothetical protein
MFDRNLKRGKSFDLNMITTFSTKNNCLIFFLLPEKRVSETVKLKLHKHHELNGAHAQRLSPIKLISLALITSLMEVEVEIRVEM